MEVRLKKIMQSQLMMVQKIDALKTFLLPSIDFILLNGDVGESRLEKMDHHIRASIDEVLRIRRLPIECHHASWRDGGLSCSSLVDRGRVHLVRSFGQIILSKDRKVRETIRWFANNERDHRGIEVDPESNFLDWKDEHGRKGTATSTGRTRKASQKMKVTLKLINEEMQLKNQESE
jgi:hypothetical protein